MAVTGLNIPSIGIATSTIRARSRNHRKSVSPLLVYPFLPFAAAIDYDPSVPFERVHLLLDGKTSWVEVGHPKESIADWHQRLGLAQDEPESPD